MYLNNNALTYINLVQYLLYTILNIILKDKLHYKICTKYMYHGWETIMPIYEYTCTECAFRFEELQLMHSDTEIVCPSCTHPALRSFSVFASPSQNTSPQNETIPSQGGCGGCTGGGCACSMN